MTKKPTRAEIEAAQKELKYVMNRYDRGEAGFNEVRLSAYLKDNKHTLENALAWCAEQEEKDAS